MELPSLAIEAVTPRVPRMGPSLTLHQPVDVAVGASCCIQDSFPPPKGNRKHVTSGAEYRGTITHSLLKDDVTTRLPQADPRYRSTRLGQKAVKTGEQCHLRSTIHLYIWHSYCGSKTWRSINLLLGLLLLVWKAHAVALDNGRRFRSLVLPAHQGPSEDDRGHCHSQQTDARTVTDLVGRAELGLIDLWSLTRCTVSY